MARRKALIASAMIINRDLERQRTAQAKALATAERAAQRARDAYLRARLADLRERKRLCEELQAADAAALTDAADQTCEQLSQLLVRTLSVDDHIDFETLKEPPVLPVWGRRDLEAARPPPNWEYFALPPPTGAGKLHARGKYGQALLDARVAFEVATRDYSGPGKCPNSRVATRPGPIR